MVCSNKHLSSMLFFFFFYFLSFFSRPSLSTMFLVDGVSVLKTPIVHVGDSIMFKHKYGYDLYIFRSKDAFNICNFAQATLLTKPNSTSFTWYPSRIGFYYFSFANNNTSLPKTCQLNQKFTFQVILSAASPPSQPPTLAPVPVSEGGVVSSSPSYPWPLGPKEASAFSPGPSPAETTSVTVPGKDGVPFINSNPAVPLPTGEVDSASINPLPTSTNAATHHVMMMTLTMKLGLCCVAMLLLM